MLRATLRVLWNSFVLQNKINIVGDLLFTLLIQPVILTLLTVGYYFYGGQPDLGLFTIIGTGLMSIWNNNLFSSGFLIQQERRAGTLPLVMAAPTEFQVVLVGKSLANSISSILAMGITFLTGIIAFHIPVGIEKPFVFFIGLVLTVTALTCLGLVLGSLFVLSRNTPLFVSATNYPIYLLSGLTIPLTLLPFWTKPLSSLLAPTWGNILLNQAAGVFSGEVLPTCLWLVCLSLLYLLIARYLYGKVEYRARAAGTLEMW